MVQGKNAFHELEMSNEFKQPDTKLKWNQFQENWIGYARPLY